MFFCFLDLGANIGMFTLAVAAMGRKAKAVDAAFKNHAYIRYRQMLQAMPISGRQMLQAMPISGRQMLQAMPISGRQKYQPCLYQVDKC